MEKAIDDTKRSTFIDLFAGIGGFHFGFAELSNCVFASEIDVLARKTYEHNFKESNPKLFENDFAFFNKDITEIDLVSNPDSVPNFDILCGGFPCQPFSQAGKRQGFQDEKNRGILFENILHIVKYRSPKAIFLENVRGLRSHKFDGGRTLEIILEKLRDLGYTCEAYDVRASDFGLPQHRPRIFIIAFLDKDQFLRFEDLRPKDKTPLKFTMSDVMGGSVPQDIGFTLRLGGRGSGVKDRRNWDEYLVDGHPKRLSPSQAARMQGFPKEFSFPPGLSENAKMKQLGNSVAVPAIRGYAKAIVEALGYST